ncbi:TspO/MBR family protein [Streptomonospora algeriensis]|uniref:TspO/MBR family protein n=1 Tax=Streptomonospora algeriensis TaxID=995084 RepID=A0ABW3BBU1_9ACTN
MAEDHARPALTIGRSAAGLVVFALAVAAAALVGVFSALDSADEYARLQQPAWAPPSWVFGPVWTVLYAMIALAGWEVWRRLGWRGARSALTLYTAQLVLNAAWTPLFFAAGLRAVAFAEIVVLWLVLTATVVVFFGADRRAALLMVPYWVWTTFAAALNFAVWQLNAGG